MSYTSAQLAARLARLEAEADLVQDSMFEGHEGDAAVRRLRVPSSTVRRVAKQEAFLKRVRRHGVRSRACREVEISYGIVSVWMHDEAFMEAYQEALVEAGDLLEEEALRRAVDGVDEPVIFQGMPTYLEDPNDPDAPKKVLTVKKYSDSLLSQMLRAKKPDEYRDNASVKHEVAVSGVLVVPAMVSRDAWAAAAEEHRSDVRPGTGEPDDGPPRR